MGKKPFHAHPTGGRALWILSLFTPGYPESSWLTSPRPTLEVATSAVALLTLRHPRPSLKRLSLGPGFVACGAAVVIVSIGAAVNVLYLGMGAVLRHCPGGWVPYQDRDLVFFSNHVGQISYAMPVCWGLMAT